jgi:hypothetical protein
MEAIGLVVMILVAWSAISVLLTLGWATLRAYEHRVAAATVPAPATLTASQ